jgi:hypothetical protein
MAFALFQVPPTPTPGTSQTTRGSPPERSIRLILPPLKNAMNRLSGDQIRRREVDVLSLGPRQ